MGFRLLGNEGCGVRNGNVNWPTTNQGRRGGGKGVGVERGWSGGGEAGWCIPQVYTCTCFISPPNVYISNTWLVPGITGGYTARWCQRAL